MSRLLAGAFITNSIPEIQKMVNREIVKYLNPRLAQVANGLQKDLSIELPRVFHLSPEYKSISSGMLQAHFGLRPGEADSKVQSIVDTIGKSVKVDFSPLKIRGASISGGIRLYAIQSDFNDILSLPAALQVTESGQTLPWLEWLLLKGDRVIIADYYFKPGTFDTSRSGKGIMVFGETKFWKVPAMYSGTIRNNWITRTINATINDIEIITNNIFKKHI